MLKGTLIHPQVLDALGRAGHGSRVLIADSNYPAATTLGPNARLVHLNLVPGVVDGVTVLEALCAAIPVEAAAVMATLDTGPHAMDEDPPIWSDYRRVLADHGHHGELERIERHAFYETAARPDVALTLQTGEERIYANLLLTVGVVSPESP